MNDWRRLSARMLLVHPVREVIRFLPVLLGLLVAGSRGDGDRWWWSLIGTAVAVLFGLLRWFTTRYRITPEQIQLRSGLINKVSVSAATDRVRSVDVSSSVLHRALGLAQVRIGTGSGEKQLRLDGLGTAEAAGLRAELLHRQPVATPSIALAGTEAAGPSPTALPGVQPVTAAPHVQPVTAPPHVQPVTAPPHVQPSNMVGQPPSEEELYLLDPAWIRYAPFSPASLLAALAIVGVGSQLLSELGGDLEDSETVIGAVRSLQGLGAALLIGLGLLTVAIFVVLLSLVGYLLAFHGFRLTRDNTGRSLHVSRGLLTTRATSLEIRRLRGTELHESIPLRWVRGAHLRAITTGVKSENAEETSTLAPSSPVGVIRNTADRVLNAPGVATTPLRAHGPAATHRRYSRALVGTSVLAAGIAALAVLTSRWWLGAVAIALIGVGALLGWDRARMLGHAVNDRFLVSRSGSMTKSTAVVELAGAVGVQLRQSFFQRRAGVATVSLATAAGRQGYQVVDVDVPIATRVAAQILPGQLEQFLERPQQREPSA